MAVILLHRPDLDPNLALTSRLVDSLGSYLDIPFVIHMHIIYLLGYRIPPLTAMHRCIGFSLDPSRNTLES